MNKTYWWIATVGSAYFLSSLYMYVMPEILCGLAFVVFLAGLAFTFVITAILGLTRWRKTYRSWMAPSVICLVLMASVMVSSPLGRHIADWRFKQHLSEYNSVVNDVKNDTVSCGASCGTELHETNVKILPPNTIAIRSAQCENGALIVAFFLDTDVPMLHEGYLYNGFGENNVCVTADMKRENEWPYMRHVIGNWYHFSDEPGL
jgi:hypothetical protein